MAKKRRFDDRSITLPVDEAMELLRVFNDSQALRNLSGRQRQELDEARTCLRDLLKNGVAVEVSVPVTALRALLRAAAHSQEWIDQAWAELPDADG